MAAGSTSSSLIACGLSCGAGLEAAHVEQVPHESVEPVGFLVDRGQELVLCFLCPVNILLEQARHRRFDRSKRCAEIVRHR